MQHADDLGKLLLRLVLGALILLHGISKVLAGPGLCHQYRNQRRSAGRNRLSGLSGRSGRADPADCRHLDQTRRVDRRRQYAVRRVFSPYETTADVERSRWLGAGTAGHVSVYRTGNRVSGCRAFQHRRTRRAVELTPRFDVIVAAASRKCTAQPSKTAVFTLRRHKRTTVFSRQERRSRYNLAF
jgi:hypothetical protein